MPRKMGKYIIGGTLGEGGYSKVKLGTHEKTGEKVALKILKKSNLKTDSNTKRQVEREIASLAKIKHKNVIHLKHVDWNAVYEKKNGQKMEVTLVVLELATGGELFEFLSFTGKFDDVIGRTFFHQLIDGVGFAHQQGVAHRDLKPENLLLSGDFVLKIADFGFAQVFNDSNKMMHTECGTPGYMAPEMFQNGREGYEGTLADIWSCGVVLFIMLSGFPPFQQPNLSDWWFHKLANGKHSLFWQAHTRSAYFSELTKDLINKILQPDASKRITIEEIKSHEWFSGATISERQVFSELSQRKVQVDEQKKIEKLNKDRENAAKHRRGASSLDDVTVRGVSVGESDLPDGPPALHPGNFADVFVVPDRRLSALTSGDLGGLCGMVGMGMGMEEDEEEKAPIPKFEPDTVCYTSFRSESEPQEVLNKIASLLEGMGGQYSLKEREYKLKGEVTTGLGRVVLTARIFADEKAKNNVVELRRRQGNGEQFRSLYWTLRSAMGDLAVQQKVSVTESSEEDEEVSEEKSQ